MKKRFRGLGDYVLAIVLYLFLNVALFHGGLYRFVCKVDSYAGNVYGRMQVLEATEKQTRKRVVALVGDSTTEEGIDPDLLSQQIGKPVVNLALPGTSPHDWSYFLRSIDPERNRFEAILLTVVPQKTRAQTHDDGIQTLLPVADPFLMVEYLDTRGKIWSNLGDYYGAFDRVFAFRRDLRDLILSPDRWLHTRAARQQKLETIRNYSGENYDVCSVRTHPQQGKVVRWGKIRDEEIRHLIRNNVNQISKLNRAPAVSGISEHLETIVESYRNSPTQIIIVNIPFGYGHHVPVQSPLISRYLNTLQAFGNDWRVLHWMAFEEALFQECSNFFDFRHLNHKGRKLFTRWLAEKWNQSAEQQPVAEIR